MMQMERVGEKERILCYRFLQLYYALYQNSKIAREEYLRMKQAALYDWDFLLVLSKLKQFYPLETQDNSKDGDSRELLERLYKTGAIDGADYESAMRLHFL